MCISLSRIVERDGVIINFLPIWFRLCSVFIQRTNADETSSRPHHTMETGLINRERFLLSLALVFLELVCICINAGGNEIFFTVRREFSATEMRGG